MRLGVIHSIRVYVVFVHAPRDVIFVRLENGSDVRK